MSIEFTDCEENVSPLPIVQISGSIYIGVQLKLNIEKFAMRIKWEKMLNYIFRL